MVQYSRQKVLIGFIIFAQEDDLESMEKMAQTRGRSIRPPKTRDEKSRRVLAVGVRIFGYNEPMRGCLRRASGVDRPAHTSQSSAPKLVLKAAGFS